MFSTRNIAVMKDGKMMLLIHGETFLMDASVITEDGSEVQSDGTVILTDGARRMLHEDEALVVDILSTQMAGLSRSAS